MATLYRIEASIQRAVVAYTRDKHPDVMIQATLNENSRHAMDMGCSPGITDLILFIVRHKTLYVLFLELKKKKGKLSSSQITWADNRPLADNCSYAVGYGYHEAISIIDGWVGNIRKDG